MKILITGGAGFIGSHLVDACLVTGHEVAVIDNFSTGNHDNLSHHTGNSNLEVYEADICDAERVLSLFRIFQPETVFHLAAQINVRESIKNPRYDAQINIQGSLNILESMRETGCARMIFSSTGGAMFGGGVPPYLEIDIANPETPYGISKRTIEMLLEFYSRTYGINSTILRYSNVYGPRQNAAGEAGVISIFQDKMTKNESPIIYGDGTQTRDFIHVSDVVSANLHALEKNLTGIFHVGTGIETSINDLWKILNTQGNLEPTYVPSLGEIQRTSLDSTKLQKTGWMIREKL